MAVVAGCTLHNFRIILVSLGIGTVFLVLISYGVTSGMPYRYHDSLDVEAEDVIHHNLHNNPTRPIKNGTNLFLMKASSVDHVTTSGRRLSQARTKIPEEMDLKKIDMSEEFECDKRCQEKIQDIRQRGVSNACAFSSKVRKRPNIWDSEGNLRADQMKRLNHLFPIYNTKSIYCSVPKDGCSAWKRVLLEVAGYKPDNHPHNIHPFFHSKFKALSTYNVTEAQEILKTYQKFIFVREPFQRMLSLFMDKSLKKHDFPFNETQFEWFLKYILKKPVIGRSKGYSEHWTHATFLCLPCDVSYSFIGRLETSKRDYDYIFENILNVKNITIKKPSNFHTTHSSDPTVKDYYIKQVNNSILREIYDRYKLDYVTFTYDKPDFMRLRT